MHTDPRSVVALETCETWIVCIPHWHVRASGSMATRQECREILESTQRVECSGAEWDGGTVEAQSCTIGERRSNFHDQVRAMTVEYVQIDKFIERDKCELVFCAIISDHRGRSRDSRLHAAEARRLSGEHAFCTLLNVHSHPVRERVHLKSPAYRVLSASKPRSAVMDDQSFAANVPIMSHVSLILPTSSCLDVNSDKTD